MSPTTIVKAIQTTVECPSQWDAWTDEGQYLYLRYRSGIGTVEERPGPDWETWDLDTQPIIEFGEPSMGDSYISLADFCAATGLVLAPGAVADR